MSKIISLIILIIVVLNVSLLFVYFNRTSGNVPQTLPVSNKTSKVVTKTAIIQNVSTNLSETYKKSCINSTEKYASNIVNITNTSVIETKFFNKSSDVKSYLQHNWSSALYDFVGMEKDITNYTVVSVFNITTNRGRNFTLPILCNENGKIGNYSSCLLDNIPNIPSSCFNFTINVSECEIEWRDHFLMDDIEYWVYPLGGALYIPSLGISNTTMKFNFTIRSSRKRLEYFGFNVIERTFSPINDDTIFSSTKLTPDGKGGTITTTVNITGKRNVEYYVTAWFKKKCYDKYTIY